MYRCANPTIYSSESCQCLWRDSVHVPASPARETLVGAGVTKLPPNIAYPTQPRPLPRRLQAGQCKPVGSSSSMGPQGDLQCRQHRHYHPARGKRNSQWAALKRIAILFRSILGIQHLLGAGRMDLMDQLETLKARIVGLCRCPHDGNDLFQDVWIRCSVSREPQYWANPRSGLIMTIARNLLHDRQRKRMSELRCLHRLGSEVGAGQFARSCGADIEERESRRVLRSAIGQLPTHYRTCIETALELGGTSDATATFLGIDPATFRTRIRRARGLIRDFVANN